MFLGLCHLVFIYFEFFFFGDAILQFSPPLPQPSLKVAEIHEVPLNALLWQYSPQWAEMSFTQTERHQPLLACLRSVFRDVHHDRPVYAKLQSLFCRQLRLQHLFPCPLLPGFWVSWLKIARRLQKPPPEMLARCHSFRWFPAADRLAPG